MIFRKTLIAMILVIVTVFTLVACEIPVTGSLPLQQATPTSAPMDIDQAVEMAFQNAVQEQGKQVLELLIYDVVIDHFQYSNDRTSALLWLALRDQETGIIVASEPGLSIAQNSNPSALGDPGQWRIVLPSDQQFIQQLEQLPDELLTGDIRSRYLDPKPQEVISNAAVLTGYKLPWTAGLSKRITNSIGHVYPVNGGLTSCPNTCRYAYDFADGSMFPLLAAKGGTVKAFKWSCSNFGESCTNYLVLEDQSTIPTSYQLYYHMAYDSLPARLRQVGERVNQGEYIGDVDDTGYSTGHHLHYHVYYTPNSADWSWGASVDFAFDDVPVNGGHPRTCSESTAYPNMGSQCLTGNLYISGNTPAHPPSATLAAPADRQIITSRTVRVEGTASDDIQIARIQVLANYNGTWKTIDDIPPGGNGPFARDVDLCAGSVPTGPFGLKVNVYDREGSLAPGMPVRQLINNGSCAGTVQPPPAPVCMPNDNQVALYAETDFRGACKKFDLNNNAGYTVNQLGSLGDNEAASIQVGANVSAILFERSSDVTANQINGRVETLESSDTALADNLIGENSVSGLWVKSRTTPPDEPFIRVPGSQWSASTSPSSLDSLVLAWEGGLGATSYDVSLSGPGASWTRTVSGRTSLSIGSLAAGNYSITVRAKNSAGNNSSSKSFAVTSGSFPAASSRGVPFDETFEAGPGSWVASGLWRHAAVEVGGQPSTKAWVFNNGTSTDDATWKAGDLTSPPISIPSSGTYFLRFLYYTDVEDGRPDWDQRRVQISDGGAFTDLLQLSDDKQIGPIWLKSGPISLANYAGKTVRLRFHYDSVDEDNNGGAGWMIDSININTQGPVANCADSNDTPATAQPVTLGTSVSAVICPERDVDFYRFTATAGQNIVVDINAKTLSPASKLDSYVFLLDSSGRNVVAENDDEQYGVVQDSLLSYVLQRDGTYYLKVKAWDYPGVGSTDYFYQMGLNQNLSQPPRAVSILYPPANRLTPTVPFQVSASAVDYDGGQVAKMDFYWHGPDWSKPEWVLLGYDVDGSDGWTFDVNPNLYGSVQGSALYVQAHSRMGGVLGTVMWDLLPDQTTPVSTMTSLPAQTNSTVVRLSWTASDPQNDITRFEIQYQANNGSGWSGWQNWTARSLAPNLSSTWFAGSPGYSYRFRMRAVDRAGNVETYLDTPEATTKLSATCTPDPGEIAGQTRANATLMQGGSLTAVYNQCKSAQAGAGDVDWLAFDARQGDKVLVMLLPKSGGASFVVNLYNSGQQKLGSWQSVDYEKGVSIRWNVAAAGRYYLEILPLTAELFGTDTRYQVWQGPGHWLYMPWMGN